MATVHSPQNDYTEALAVTPNDNTDLAAGQTRGLFFSATAAQTLSVITASGTTTSFTFGAAGTYVLPLAVSRVRSTGTNVTGIVALY